MDNQTTDAMAVWAGLRNQLEKQLAAIGKEEARYLHSLERSIRTCMDTLERLTNTLSEYELKAGEGTLFFKEIRPFFLGRLIFYTRLYEMELDRPPNGSPDAVTYFQKELQRIEAFATENRFIHRYLLSGATYLDDRLFFKANREYVSRQYALDLPVGDAFGTSFEPIAARINAGQLLHTHILSILEDLRQPGRGASTSHRLTWTDSKTALIELAYALQSAGSFNNGKIELKEIIDYFQAIFGVNLGNYPRTFQEILSRKTGYTNFIDKLRDKLLLRIQNIEEKYEP